MLIRIAEFGVVFLLVLIVALQVLIPGVRDEPLWPWFRKKSKRHRQIAEMNARIEDLDTWKKEKQTLTDRISELETRDETNEGNKP